MTNVKKFDFKQTYEEVEIAGDAYKIYFSDAKLEEYMKKIHHFRQEAIRLHNIDTTEMEQEQQLALFNEIQDITKDLIETFLGEGTYDRLYEKSGNSIMNMMDLGTYLADIVNERTKKEQASRKGKYVNKNKKAHANVLADPFA